MAPKLQTKKEISQELLVLGMGLLAIIAVVAYSFSSGDSSSSPSSLQQEEDDGEVSFITPEELSQILFRSSSLILVDIRSQKEWERKHIPHSQHLPSLRDFSLQPDPTKRIVLIASSQQRKEVRSVALSLQERGWNVSVLRGGFEAWERSFLPTRGTADPTSPVDISKVVFVKKEELPTFLQKHYGKVLFLDVRGRTAFQQDSLERSMNIPLSLLEKRSQEIPPAPFILVYGKDLYESFQGGVALFDLNFSHVYTFQGGYEELKELLQEGKPSPEKQSQEQSPQKK